MGCGCSGPWGPTALEPALLEPALDANRTEALFDAIDVDKNGSLDAAKLLNCLTALGKDYDLDAEAIAAIIRDVDNNGDGVVQLSEFVTMMREPVSPAATPHLVLNFDVNRTVLMLDSAVGADLGAMLNQTLASAAWGRVEDAGDGQQPTWTLVSTTPALTAPETGLKTYAQFASMVTPLAGLAADESRTAKTRRRKMIQTFADSGEPGERFGGDKAALAAALQLPAGLDASLCDAAGLVASGCYQLLPSFLQLIRQLKSEGRSFSLSFRTFGGDLAGVLREYNALCEGRHPLFASAPEKIVLDGSDGHPDMRIATEGAGAAKAIGTWVRAGAGGAELYLALGTHEQPPKDLATSPRSFYSDREGVELLEGRAAIKRVAEVLHAPGRGAALGLRDYYPAWEASGYTAAGGKPLYVECDRPDLLQIMFDDHILPSDAHIVDARRAERPEAPPLPIAATFNKHLVRAEPFKSILDKQYFRDAIARAEGLWRQSAARRAKLVRALSDYERLLAHLGTTRQGEPAAYVPHAQSQAVLLASDAHAFERLHRPQHDEEGVP